MRVSTLLAPVVLTGIVVLAACSGGATEGGDATPQDSADGAAVRLDQHRTLGAPLTVGNLRVWPVHTDAPLDVGDFLTLSEAQESGVAKIREVGGGGAQQTAQLVDVPLDLAEENDTEDVAAADGGGNDSSDEIVEQAVEQVLGGLGFQGGATVGTLVIENTGDRPILIMAGTIVKGGNQDRQLGQDVVVAAGATVPVEAFCVEQGRWSAQREGVATAGEFVALDMVTNVSVRKNAQYAKDQSAVWEEVAYAREVAFAPSIAAGTSIDGAFVGAAGGGGGGSTLVDVLEKVDPAISKQREETSAAIMAHFAALAGGDDAPVGFAYAIGGEPVTVRTFAHSRLLTKHVGTFANAMALDASLADEGDATCSAADVVAMVEEISQAAETRSETGALNGLGLRVSKVGWNGNCYVDIDGDGNDEALTQDWTRR